MTLTFNTEKKSCDKALDEKFITILSEIFRNKIDSIRQQEAIVILVCSEIENIKQFFSGRIKSIQNVFHAVLKSKNNLKSLESVSLEDFDFAILSISEKRREYEQLIVELNNLEQKGNDFHLSIQSIEGLLSEITKAEIAISDYYNGCVLCHRD